MQFHDKRRCVQGEGADCCYPLSRTLERLVAAVMAGTAAYYIQGDRSEDEYAHTHITAADHDPKTGLSLDHLQLNDEPKWLDDEFKARWKDLFGTTLRSELLENTEFKRYAWGVWEE